MDYRKFLGKTESVVLPYLGSGTVDTATRRLRVTTPVTPGWWRFELRGRDATAREPAGPEGLDGLPRVRGFLWGTRLVREGAVAEPLELMPEEQPPVLAPVSARRWHDGTLLFDSVEFEGEAEDLARRAMEAGQPLSSVKGVSAPLRAAFGYVLLEAASRAMGIWFVPAETRTRVLGIAERGRAEAEECLRTLLREREAHQRALAVRQEHERHAALVVEARDRVKREHLQHRPQTRRGDLSRAEAALHRAGARLLNHRQLGGNQLEVTYSFMEERFISIVDADSLQVVDAGLCLAGADSAVTLESLPSVIREAIDTGVLVVTRHG
ncbi:hypothetical protein [Myxococcus landrumensis]|uniref:Uncharacterized protein n=1 Tax=Myxococcus landrumensis TaxID=2813577 RepID=A0ABX7NGU4_9BACT|nr:hypothetical protein [Myxococcus landrumus]QSQ17853.1 hypothetical protein JY572_18230 [Myxococcus landrumus]